MMSSKKLPVADYCRPLLPATATGYHGDLDFVAGCYYSERTAPGQIDIGTRRESVRAGPRLRPGAEDSSPWGFPLLDQ